MLLGVVLKYRGALGYDGKVSDCKLFRDFGDGFKIALDYDDLGWWHGGLLVLLLVLRWRALTGLLVVSGSHAA